VIVPTRTIGAISHHRHPSASFEEKAFNEEEIVYSVMKIEVILAVPSIEKTAAWYERVLGWTYHYDVFDAEGHCTFGSVSCGDGEFRGFNLSRVSGERESYNNDAANFTAFIAVDDVDAVYAQVMEGGEVPDSEPEDQLWGGRVFSMRDLNGFRLTFYQLMEEVTVEEVRRRHQEALRAG
jgi:uncharacterized glyoxalase superfamily protein PhnB